MADFEISNDLDKVLELIDECLDKLDSLIEYEYQQDKTLKYLAKINLKVSELILYKHTW